MLRSSALRARKQNAPRPEWKVAEAYLQWLRGRPCYLDGEGGCGLGKPERRSPIEAAHVDHAGKGTADAKGFGTKAADHFAIPLCQRHHDEQGGKVGSFRQRGGWKTFQIKYGFDAEKVANDYYGAWLKTPMGQKWTAANG